MGGGSGPNLRNKTTFTINLTSTLINEYKESISESITQLLKNLEAGEVIISFRDEVYKIDALTEFPVNEQILINIITDFYNIQTLGDGRFIIAEINERPLEYKHKIIIVPTFIENKEIAITYIDTENDKDIVQRTDWTSRLGDKIPYDFSIIFGKNVTTIGENAFSSATLPSEMYNISINIPAGLKEIRNRAFENNFFKMSYLTFPEGFTTIGKDSFSNFYSLTGINPDDKAVCEEINIPKSLIIPPGGIFFNYEIKEITVNEENPNYLSDQGILFNKNKTILVKYPSLKNEKEYNIPESVNKIENSAFSLCLNLNSILLHQNIFKLGRASFSFCASLTTITVPPEVTIIEASCFYQCLSLQSITLPSNLILIDEISFEGCSSLTTITIPDTVLDIGQWAFGLCTSLTTITIPALVTRLKQSTFQKCRSLKSIYFANDINLSTIEKDVFNECNSLSEISIPPTVNSIGFRCFTNCTSLKSITIPNSVEIINSYLFNGCTSLESINLQNGVKEILNEAFLGCTSLKSIDLPNGLIGIGDEAFRNCTSLPSIIIPISVERLSGFSIFENCINLETVTFKDGRDEDLLLYNSLFRGCVALAAIDLPDKVLFNNEDLEENDISTFEGCTSLAKVTVRDSRVTEYMGSVFKDVPAVQAGSLNFNVANALTEIEFGADNEAFSNKSTELDPPNKLYFGARDSGGVGLKKVLLSDRLIKYFQLNVPLSSLNAAEQDSIKVSVGDLLSTLGGAVTVEILPYPDSVGLTLVKATTTNEVDTAVLAEKVTKAGEIQTLGDSNFIIAKINGTSMEYNNKLIIVKTDNTVAYVDVGVPGEVKRSDWENEGITKNQIKHVAFGKDVTVLGDPSVDAGDPNANVFQDCKYLETVTLSPETIIIGGSIFNNCILLKSFYITKKVIDMYSPGEAGGPTQLIFNGSSLESYYVDEKNQRYYSVDGVLFKRDTPITFISLIAFPIRDPRTSYTVPEGVTDIAGSAFSDCTSLASIILAETVARISSGGVFSACTSLASMTIPKGVISITGKTFKNCVKLETVTFEGGRQDDVELPFEMFSGCETLAAIDLPEKVLIDIEGDFPYEKATSLFEGCTSLAKVTVRDSRVTEYLESAFKDVPAVQAGSLNFNVANDLNEIEFGADNEAFSNKSTELDPPNKLYFGANDSGGDGLKKVLLDSP